MRMWMIPPEMMCKKHLNGEHFEIHLHKHNFIKKHSIKGRIFPIVQIQPNAMKSRHDQLAKYLKKHESSFDMPDLSYLPKEQREAKVDIDISIKDLCDRCPDCKSKILEYNKKK